MKINMERRLSFKYNILTIAFLSTLIVTCSQNINEEFADDSQKNWCMSKYNYLIEQTIPYDRNTETNEIYTGGGWKNLSDKEWEEIDRIQINLKTAKISYYDSIEAIDTEGDNPQNDIKWIISRDPTVNWDEIYGDIWLDSDLINWVLFGEDLIKGRDEDFNNEFKRMYGYNFNFSGEEIRANRRIYSNRDIFNTELLLLRTDNEGALKLCKVWEELSY